MSLNKRHLADRARRSYWLAGGWYRKYTLRSHRTTTGFISWKLWKVVDGIHILMELHVTDKEIELSGVTVIAAKLRETRNKFKSLSASDFNQGT